MNKEELHKAIYTEISTSRKATDPYELTDAIMQYVDQYSQSNNVKIPKYQVQGESAGFNEAINSFMNSGATYGEFRVER